MKFGTKSNFPEPWRSALFILDWAYGKISAVHLEHGGATYTGKSEVFLKGRPLNVTGVDFGPGRSDVFHHRREANAIGFVSCFLDDRVRDEGRRVHSLSRHVGTAVFE